MKGISPRLRAQMVKELLSVLRDPRSRMILIVPPLLQLLIFSFAATLDVRNVTLAVFNDDNGRMGYEWVQRVAAADFVSRVIPVHNYHQLHRAIDNYQAMVAVTIPADFSRRIRAGEPAQIQVIADGRRANAGQVAMAYLQSITSQLGYDIAMVGAEDAVAVRHAFNSNLTYRWFIVTGLTGILSMLTSLAIATLSIARERELGTFEQLLVSPCSSTEIILAKALPPVIFASTLGLLMALAGHLLFAVPFTGSWLWLLVSLISFIAAVVGMGLMVSAFCHTQQQAILGTFALAIPMILMSGFVTPVSNMPPLLQYLAQLMPLKHFLVILRGSFLKAMPLPIILANLWPILLIASATLSLAVWVVRRQLR